MASQGYTYSSKRKVQEAVEKGIAQKRLYYVQTPSLAAGALCVGSDRLRLQVLALLPHIRYLPPRIHNDDSIWQTGSVVVSKCIPQPAFALR